MDSVVITIKTNRDLRDRIKAKGQEKGFKTITSYILYLVAKEMDKGEWQ